MQTQNEKRFIELKQECNQGLTEMIERKQTTKQEIPKIRTTVCITIDTVDAKSTDNLVFVQV